MNSFSTDTKVGELVASYSARFSETYPPYINYLDQSLQLIKDIQERNYKFKAFLRSILAQQAYSRQGLCDLLSLPIQEMTSTF